MPPWQREELLDIRCVHLDAQIEEEGEYYRKQCEECEYERGGRECMNCYIGGY